MKFKVIAFILLSTAVLGFSQETEEDFQEITEQEENYQGITEQEENNQRITEQEDDYWYIGKPIANIVFTGLNNIQISELDALIQSYRGVAFSDAIFWEIQGKLYAMEYFERIDPSIVRANLTGSEAIIRFNVIERPVISRINFIGNNGLRNRELNEVIISKASDILNQAKIRLDIEAIVNKYLEKGYPNVNVTTEEIYGRDRTVTLNFRIFEREKISISKIEFQGNARFSSNTLRSQLSLKAKSLINDGAFQEAKLLADRETVTMYYRDRGYINAVVRDVTRTYETEGNNTNLTLTFMIEEGDEYRFGGITFEGNRIFTTEQLNKLITIKNGDILNTTKLENDLQNVADLYFENGYIFNSIIRTPNIDEHTKVLSYTINMIERNRAYIESITVIGNEKTKTDVILREIPMEPGDVFSKTKIMDAMRNLYNLQFFSIIIPDTLPGSAENLMDLVFTVEEQMTTDIQFGLTFTGIDNPEAFPISGLFEFTDRNFIGSGNEMGVKLNSSIVDTTKLALNYNHRWVMGMPLSLGLDFTTEYSKHQAAMMNRNWWFNGDEPEAFPDGFNSYNDYINHKKLPPNEYLMNYMQWYISIGLSSGYRWATFLGNFGLSGGIRLGITRDSYDEIFRPFDPVMRAGNNKWTPRNSLWSSLSLDKRDIYFDPSSGFYLSQRTGFYGIFNNELEHYVRSDSKAEYFLTLFDLPVTTGWRFKSVLALHAGITFLVKQPFRDGPVVQEANKLAIDGMFTGRGWSDIYREKGLTLIDSWIELRFPIVPGILAFDLFLDGAGIETMQGYYLGNNSAEESNFTINNFRFSFGGGLRMTLPQLPLRLSIAKRFRFEENKFTWVSGALFGDNRKPGKGVDIVLSFVLSY